MIRTWAGPRPCGVCHRPLLGPAAVLPTGGPPFCSDHPVCLLCAAPHRDLRCDGPPDGVRDASTATALAVRVHRQLREVGVALPADVPVTLVDTMPGNQLGVTSSTTRGPQRSSSIRIRRGLGRLRFGSVVAHELTHAWMHEVGIRPADATTAEGACELVALVWLGQQPDDAARRGVADQILLNGDPTYRTGAERAVAAAGAFGVPAVLESLQRTDDLPPV